MILFIAVILFSARETDQPVQRVKGVDPPRLCVTVGDAVVYESRGGIGDWRSGSSWLTGEPVALEDLAERMEYDTVSETQAKCTFTLPPNGISLRCYQYIDGKLIPGETTLSEADGTLELLPGKWIYGSQPAGILKRKIMWATAPLPLALMYNNPFRPADYGGSFFIVRIAIGGAFLYNEFV